MSNITFDPYEYIAIVVPGAVAALGLIIEWPELKAVIVDGALTIGGLGLFIILSFILGHLVQAGGNFIEALFWKPFGGKPTDWVLKPDQTLLSSAQRDRLIDLLSRHQNRPIDFSTMTKSVWSAITREIYSTLSKAQCTQRIDAFNRTYGLMRGITAGLLVLAIIFYMADPGDFKRIGVAIFLAILALYRMFRFGRNYGRELLVEYVDLPDTRDYNIPVS